MIDKNIKECPYCGSEEYYIKQSFKGICEYVLRFDGEDTDNGHIHDGIEYSNVNKYAYCDKCKKRLFKLDE